MFSGIELTYCVCVWGGVSSIFLSPALFCQGHPQSLDVVEHLLVRKPQRP